MKKIKRDKIVQPIYELVAFILSSAIIIFLLLLVVSAWS